MFGKLRHMAVGLESLKRNWLMPTSAFPSSPVEESVSPREPAIFKDDLLRFIPSGPPVYNPEAWNKYAYYFNCYAYALRIPEAGWAIPGSLAVSTKAGLEYTRAGLHERLQTDGLERVREHGGRAGADHIVAAFLAITREVRDIHFYSLDADGTWSHKMGDRWAEKQDAAGAMITDVRKADRQYRYFNYRTFVGFYRIPAEGISYLGRNNMMAPRK